MTSTGNKYTNDRILDFKNEETVNKDTVVFYSNLYNDQIKIQNPVKALYFFLLAYI